MMHNGRLIRFFIVFICIFKWKYAFHEAITQNLEQIIDEFTLVHEKQFALFRSLERSSVFFSGSEKKQNFTLNYMCVYLGMLFFFTCSSEQFKNFDEETTTY